MGIRLVVHNFTGIKNSSSSHDHDKLIHRDMEDQHPISAITGLQDVINELRDHNVTKFEDTDSIDFRINSRTNTLEADVRVDPNPKNTITITNNGLFIDGNTVQVEELPEPCAEEEGNVYQYIGDTTEYWLKDIFYECKENPDKKVYGYRYGNGIEFYVPSNAITDGAFIYSNPNCVSPFGQIQGVGENDAIAIRVYGSGGDWNSGAVGNGNVWRDTSLDVSHYYWDIATTNYQLTEFPTLQPNSDYVGKAFQYTGESNDNFHKSEFYRCELDEGKQLYVYPVSLNYGNTRYLYSSLPVSSVAGSYLYDAIDEQGNLTGDAHYVSSWSAGTRGTYGTVDGIGYVQCFTSFRLPIYKWVSLNLSADRLNLEDLKNVNINAVANNQIIRYKDGFWINDTEAPIPELSNDNPLMDGTATPGTSEKTSRSDHVHPHDTTKQDVIQYSSMPTPKVDLVGKVYQYTGATNSKYKQGQFYVCYANATVTRASIPTRWGTFYTKGSDPRAGDRLYTEFECINDIGYITARDWMGLHINTWGNSSYPYSWSTVSAMEYLWKEAPDSVIQDSISSTTTTYSSSKIDTLIDNTNTSLTTLINDTNTALTTEINNLKDTKQDVIQYSILPTPAPKYKGKVFQYIGETNNQYTKGHFYEIYTETGLETITGTLIYSNTYSSDWNVTNAIDGNTNTAWLNYSGSAYIGYKNISPFVFKSATMVRRDCDPYYNDNNFVIQGSTDGTNWVNVSETINIPKSDTSTKTFTFDTIDNTNGYTWIRLYIPNGLYRGMSGFNSIAEIKFEKLGTYSWKELPDCFHKHDNKEQLDKITEKDGDPYYDNRMFLMEDTYSDEDIEQAILDVLDELNGKLNNNVFFTSDMEVFTTSDGLIFRVQDDDTGE